MYMITFQDENISFSSYRSDQIMKNEDQIGEDILIQARNAAQQVAQKVAHKKIPTEVHTPFRILSEPNDEMLF